MRFPSPKVTLALSAMMLIAGVACATFGLRAARAAQHSLRPVAVERYSGPVSGELIDDPAPLRQMLPEVKLNSMSLAEAVGELRRLSGANIFVNWSRLSDASPPVGPDTPVTMDFQLKDVTLGQAIAKMLDCLEANRGREDRKIWFGMSDGIITVSDDWPAFTSVGRWYYVQDLVNDPAHYGSIRPRDTRSAAPSPGLFSGSDDEFGRTRQEIEDELYRLITETIDPESWRDAGGSFGRISSWAGRLVIHQTPENHQKIESLLDNLRRGP